MDKKELIEYLKAHLSLEMSTFGHFGVGTISKKINLCIDGEVIDGLEI